MADDWLDITPSAAQGKGHIMLHESSAGLKIRFDKGKPSANGYKGKDHYHILNPDATGNKDLYLNKNGSPVKKSSRESHILPEGDA